MSSEKLGKFLREVSNWTWEEFVRAEHDKSYTSNQAIIFALIRSCVMQKMDAIKMSLNRLDGKLKTPVKIEYPKIYYLYPNAALPGPDGKAAEPKPGYIGQLEGVTVNEERNLVTGEVIPPEEPPVIEDENDLPSLSLRETLAKMSDYSREVPEAIVEVALLTEQAVRGHGDIPDDVPRVKSVVAAHLLILAHKRNIGALNEVFDQIDGKLAETIQLIGDDIFIVNYSLTAPTGAYVNKDGIMQLEANVAQDQWAEKLGRKVIQE